MAWVLSEEQISNLRKYQYKGVDGSLLSRYVYGAYWEWLVRLFPMWFAPNLITFVGLLFMVVNFGTLLYFAPTLTETLPQWVFWTFAVGLWCYMSLDAIDGKQARRTGSSTPMGELFDHGCDAINAIFVGFLVSATFGYKPSWSMIVLFFLGIVNLYMPVWEEYHTNQFYLGRINGPVEGITVLILSYIVSAIFGANVWSRTVGQITGRHIPYLSQYALTEVLIWPLIVGLTIYAALAGVWRVLQHPGVRRVYALATLLPILLQSCSFLLWARCLRAPLNTNILIFCSAGGICCINHTGRILVAHLTKSDFPLFDLGLVFLSAFSFFSSFPGLGMYYAQYEVTVLRVFFGICVARYCVFVYAIINDVCDALNIRLFSIQKPKEH